jgi:hypothetical protein
MKLLLLVHGFSLLILLLSPDFVSRLASLKALLSGVPSHPFLELSIIDTAMHD